MLKLPIFLVTTGELPAHPDAPTTAHIATLVGDLGTGPEAVEVFTDKTLAEKLAAAMPPEDGAPWSVKTLATKDEARQAIEITARRHPSWNWTIDYPLLPGDAPGTSTYFETAAILDQLLAQK